MSSRLLKIALAAALAPEALAQGSQIGMPATAAGAGVVPVNGVAPGIAGISPPLATPIQTPAAVATPLQAAAPANTGSNFADTLFGGGNSGNKGGVVDNLLKSVSATQPAFEGSDDAMTKYSSESEDIVSGVVGGLLSKAQLMPQEKSCIQDNLGGVTGSIVSVGYTIKDVAKNLMGFTEKGPAGDKHQNLNKGDLISEGLGGAVAATRMGTSIKALAKDCFKADGIQLMKTAGKHFTDPTWLRTNFANQGMNIARATADSILQYGNGNYHSFGHDIGKSFRKVLLSTSPGDSPLPVGVDPKLVTEEITEGAMNGIFQRGTGLQITDKLDPRVNINVDLNKCFYGNRREWERIFGGTWDVIAKFATQGAGVGAPAAPGAPVNNFMAGNNAWQQELMTAMMGLPGAAEKCNLGFGAFGDMKRAAKNMQGLHFKFKFPNNNIASVNDVNEKMAKSIKDWTNQDYKGFGGHLGKFIRDAGFMAGKGMMEQKFDISIEVVEPEAWEMQEPLSMGVSAMYGGIAGIFFLVLVAVRIARPSVARAGSDDDEEKQVQLTSELQEDMESSAVE